MGKSYERVRLLITVMTYPHPSERDLELVCTACITDALEWVRLYSVDYRYMPRDKQYKKYQWLELNVAPRGSGKDARPESCKPDLDSIVVCGKPLSVKNRWQARRQIIDAMPHHTVNELKVLYEQKKVSLDTVRPTRVLDMKITPHTDKWSPKQEQLFHQLRLFGQPQKPLRKLPYKFQYVFECSDSTKPHKAAVSDWELGALFLKLSESLGSDKQAAQKVKTNSLVRSAERTKTPASLWVPSSHIIPGW